MGLFGVPGLRLRRRVRLGRRAWVNVGAGVPSVSRRVGRRVTVNSRGTVSVRLLRGLSWRGRLW